MTKAQELRGVVDDSIEQFRDNKWFRRLAEGQLSIEDYHSLLTTIFNQVKESSNTFALAGANCPPRFQKAKEYLIHHADEEKSHWRWILDDLRNTGYAGPEPCESLPGPACQTYIAFNYYIAMRMPLARLAIAATLEGIGARFGGEYGLTVCRTLRLEPHQASFFLSHGETDKVHSVEIWDVLEDCELTTDEWSWMQHSARMTSNYYSAMYDDAAP